MDLIKKIIILALIVLAGHFLYKKYMEDDVKKTRKYFKTNARNVDLLQRNVKDKVDLGY